MSVLRVPGLMLGGMALLVSAGAGHAQVALGTDTEFGRLLFSANVMKSTHVGSFDVFAGPAFRDWFDKSSGSGGGVGGGGSGAGSGTIRRRPSLMRIILPDGKLPADMDWSYQARPGINLSVTLETPLIRWPQGGDTRLSVFLQHDFHKVRFNAPSGFGILIDPTTAMLKTNFLGLGFEVGIPIARLTTRTATHQFHAGLGLMHYRSTTVAQARSVFINLGVAEHRERTARISSLQYTYRPLAPPSLVGSLKWDGFQIAVHGFQTDHFWTISASAASIFVF